MLNIGAQWTIVVLVAVMAVGAALHALLRKRNPRAAFGWIAVCLLFPAAGPVLYLLFGVNRIAMRARRLDTRHSFQSPPGDIREGVERAYAVHADDLPPSIAPVARIADAVTRRPLLAGNHVEPLVNGDAAYPAMLDAIDGAERTVYACTYIFETGTVGKRFIDAFARASGRGVDVRVLIDGLGELYGLPVLASRRLAKLGVAVARFLPPHLIPPSIYVNLRNHRKILVVDGEIAFTGGMNFRDRHETVAPQTDPRLRDVHFRLVGPVVAQLEHAFLEDWGFSTGADSVPPPACDWREREPVGNARCRVVTDGPNELRDRLETILCGAIATACDRVRIMTPFFLPGEKMVGALRSAALRGVDVVVLLPESSDVVLADWACRNMLDELLELGVRVYLQPAPFVHSKFFVVDDVYALIGSANIDPRSLELNFELNVEVYDPAFANALVEHFDAARSESHPLSAHSLATRSWPIRVRDALAWLFSPYL